MILSFGNLELALLRLYQLKLPDRDYFEDSFEQRFDKLIGALKSEEHPRSVIDALIELKQLSDTRHLVAHSALYIDVFQHVETGHIVTEEAISDTRDTSKRVTLPQLRNLSEKATVLVGLIHNHFTKEFWSNES